MQVNIISYLSLQTDCPTFQIKDIDMNDSIIAKMIEEGVDLYLIKLYQDKKQKNDLK